MIAFHLQFLYLCQLYVGYNSIYYVSNVFNNVDLKSLQSTIVLLTWYDFTLYPLYLLMYFSAQLFQLGRTLF